MFDNGKPEPCPAELPASRLIGTVKSLEQSGKMLFFYSAPLIDDTHKEAVLRGRTNESDQTPLFAVFYGIVEEIDEGLLKKLRVKFCDHVL